MSKKMPFVSILILNYNGARVIAQTLDSTLQLDYPKDRYEIIVVDNNSQDTSKKILVRYAKKYPQIKLILHPTNEGFSGGNNIGFTHAKGEYVILLNNDCIVDRKWIKELIKPAEENPNVFAVNSKILLFPEFFPLQVKTDLNFMRITPELLKGNVLQYSRRKSIQLFWTSNDVNTYVVHIPAHPIQKDTLMQLKISFHTGDTAEPQKHFKVTQQKWIKKIKYTIKKTHVELLIDIDVTSIPTSVFYNKIQNAGIVMFNNGGGRDRGAVVRYYGQDYEEDHGQYEKVEEVYAACGAAVLYRKSILDTIGGFSHDYFMYYEDVDLAERARHKGYTVMYQPKAIVRHIHALSSQEWSPFFIFHAERGYLVHMAHHFPLKYFFKEYMLFISTAFGRLAAHVHHPKEYSKDIQYIKVAASVCVNFPRYMLYRLQNGITPAKTKKLFATLRNGTWIKQ